MRASTLSLLHNMHVKKFRKISTSCQIIHASSVSRETVYRKQRLMQIITSRYVLHEKIDLFYLAIAWKQRDDDRSGYRETCTASRAHTSSTRPHAIKGAKGKKKERERERENAREKGRNTKWIACPFFLHLAPPIGYSSSPCNSRELLPYG